MKKPVLLSLFVLFLFTGTAFAQKSRKSVEKFLAAVSTVENVSEEDYIKRLRPFIDPQENVDSLCADFYLNWKYNFDANNRQTAYSIESLTEENGVATVVVVSNWLMDGKDKYQYRTQATWVKRNKKWYRSGEISKRLSSTKME